jgi:hypothetical protein
MARMKYFGTDLRGDSELLLQHSRQGLGRGLARFEFSAGKFPHQAERIGATPLADQQFSVRFD